ncbi:MAG: CRISPR-associated protein Cas4 [Chloroflexota bacterium]|nr:MAG: CRISPR-associated protein Cas4 [Anaerolineaceae bacterium 4572_5.2]RLD11640.1 MAG: CRISPR-associated protein Cas4 [Chloroflexota bacterium]
MLYLAFFVFLAAIVLFWVSQRQRQSTAMPPGKVIYADTRKWGAVENPLYDAVLKLTGKPDYLVEHGGEIIPVEVKSSKVRNEPYDAHVFQLAVYCKLVETEYRRRPSYGILHYPQKTFRIDYTEELEDSLLDVLADMRRDEFRTSVPRDHQVLARCAKCGYRAKCDQSLEPEKS